jgi:non-heme chloroperoxidase
MSTIRVKDGTEIYYKDWGTGQPITFSHGWPLNADAWDAQMLYLGQQGYRVIAHDRRGHGRSGQTWQGNEMNTYADDLAELMDALDLKDTIMVGHSTGGGEVARYLGRHGTKRVAGAVLMSAVPPLMLKTAANPGGMTMSAFDELRAAVVKDRSQFFMDLSMPFYGYNRAGAKASDGVKLNFWYQGMMSSQVAAYDCIKAFSETDFNEDLKKIDVPLLVLHGEDDQIVPIDDAGRMTAKIVKGAVLKTYPGYPHGMAQIHAEVINKDLLEFIQASARTRSVAA